MDFIDTNKFNKDLIKDYYKKIYFNDPYHNMPNPKQVRILAKTYETTTLSNLKKIGKDYFISNSEYDVDYTPDIKTVFKPGIVEEYEIDDKGNEVHLYHTYSLFEYIDALFSDSNGELRSYEFKEYINAENKKEINNSQKSIEEGYELFDVDVYVTDSVYEARNRILKSDEPLRIVMDYNYKSRIDDLISNDDYDGKNNRANELYLIASAIGNLTHSHMILKAVEQGVYDIEYKYISKYYNTDNDSFITRSVHDWITNECCDDQIYAIYIPDGEKYNISYGSSLGSDGYRFEYVYDGFSIIFRDEPNDILIESFGEPLNVYTEDDISLDDSRMSSSSVEEEYDNNIDISNALNNKEEILNLIKDKFAFNGIPGVGGFYILPDGSCIKTKDHLDVDKFLLKNKLISTDDKELSYHDGSQFLNALNCIRIRLRGGKDSWIVPYLVLPKNSPTNAQYETLIKWLDIVMNKNNEIRVETEDMTWSNSKTYRNITSDEIIKKIKRYYTTDTLVESTLNEMKSKGSIKDERILNLINECIEEMKQIDFNIDLTYDDIDFEEGDTLNTFGVFYWPKDYNENSRLVLNRNMYNEPDESIKNTILHELCHYVVYKDGIIRGVYYNKNGKWKYDFDAMGGSSYKSIWTSHGSRWKEVANKVKSKTGQDIQRTDSYSTHTEVGKKYEDSIKYVVRCKNCGVEMKYTRKTDFVKDPNAKSRYGDWYRWSCGNCHKSGMFEVEEVNKNG